MQPPEQAIWQRLKKLSTDEAVTQILRETATAGQSRPFEYFYSCKRLGLSRVHQQKLAERFLERLDYGEHTFFESIMSFVPLHLFLENVARNFDNAHDKKLVRWQIEAAGKSLKFSAEQMGMIDSVLSEMES